MTNLPHREVDHILEVLADRAVHPLSHLEQAELEALLRSHPDVDEESLDLAAAALDLAMFGATFEPMPEPLRAQVSAIGRQFETPVATLGLCTTRTAADRRMSFAAWTGWIAAAASLLLAIAGWWMRSTAPASPQDALRALRATAADLQTMAWESGPTDAVPGVSGEVVWSPGNQQGFMVFRNMRPNDPGKEQYQLWIFDATRDERYPVDGGVFDITSMGECIVPINATVRVQSASLFAVTVEQPGGVVVSDRSRLPLLAQPKTSG